MSRQATPPPRGSALGPDPLNDPDPLDVLYSPRTAKPATSTTSATSTTPAQRAAAEKPTMARKAWYVTQADADALDEVVNRIFLACGAKVSKHQIIGAIIRAGADHADEITAALQQ